MKRFSLLFLAFIMTSGVLMAQRTISGSVVDDAGEAIIGANILAKGTTSGTITDFDGFFSMDVPSDVTTLVVSFTGYESREIDIIGQSNVAITISEGTTLDEFVVTGYGGQEDKASVAAAITTVQAGQIEGRANASIAQLLQAQAPGLNIATGTGQPGGNSLILIRGVTSLTGNIEPLFIIDGIPVDEDNFRSLNPNDIESVSILKDASASSLYGNRASGGVIVVTTKQGEFNSPTKVTYTGQYGITDMQSPNFSLTNSAEILGLERERGAGTGAGGFSQFVADQFGFPAGAPLTDEQIASVGERFNTDWVDIFLREGRSQSHNVGITSGGENSTLFANFGWFDQEGIARRSDLERFNFRTNFTQKADRFTASVNLSANFSRSNEIPNEFSGNLDNPFLAPYIAKPYLDPFNDDVSFNLEGDGTAGFANTPFLTLNESLLSSNSEKEIKALGNVRLSYDILDNLTASVSAGIDFTEIIDKNIQPPESLRAITNAVGEFTGTQFEGTTRDTRKNVQTSLVYNTTFNDQHFIKVSAFTELIDDDLSGFNLFQNGLFEGLVGTGAGFVPGNTQDDDGNFLFIPTVGSFQSNVAQFSVFGVAKYDYNNLFGFEASVRRDGSSRFSEENRFATFWSVAGRWNISEESFIKDLVWIDNLKLRASYGTTGNDRIFGGHYAGLDETFDLFGLGGGFLGGTALFPSQIANPELKWEVTRELNLGVDFNLFRNRLRGNIDVYDKLSSDVFANRPNTLVSGGFGNIGANVAEVSNKGVEVFLNYDLLQSNNGLNVNVFFNGSINRNRVEDLPQVEADDNGDIILDRGQRAVEAVGQPFNSFFVVEWAGVNPANGRALYRTRDGELTETFSDADRRFTGKSSLPTYQGGFGANIGYKGFNVSANFSYVADVFRNNGTFGVIEDQTLLGITNASTTLLEAWTEPGQVTAIPALNTGATRNLLHDRYLEDASYVRLRNINASYTFRGLDKLNIPLESIRLFVQGENLVTWTAWRGFDPEFSALNVSDFFAFPNPRIFTVGLDVDF